MTQTLITALIAISLINTIILVFAILKKQKGNAFDKEYFGFIAKGINENAVRESQAQRERLERLERQTQTLAQMSEFRLADMRKTLDEQLSLLRQDNNRQLDTMRQTVDEKLSQTLDKRLTDSFGLVSARLEEVFKGIGEMNKIAENVSDIKRVFSNVKMRGTWGEMQLDSLLSQMLAPNQYIKNFKLNKTNSDEMVDFAVVLPTKDGQIYLSIDAKFPLDEFNKLLDAQESYNREATEKAQKNLQTQILKQATSIAKKYIMPPITTDYAVMYFPLESLYAEAIKLPEIATILNKEHIIMCGPTNLAALLTALQTGFKTIAIERRSSELWQLLSAFKHEFSKFCEVISKTQKKLQEAQDSIDDAAKKTRTIERKLKNVAEISEKQAESILFLPD